MSECNSKPRWDEKGQKALTRMRKAYDSGKGVRISWEELEVLNRTFIGQIWYEDEPEPTYPHNNLYPLCGKDRDGGNE